MQLRRLLPLAALLLAASAAASALWSDVVIAVTYNVSTVRYCLINDPATCYFLPKFRSVLDPNKGLAVAEYNFGMNFMAVPSLAYLALLYDGFREPTPYTVTLGLRTPGHLVGFNFTVNGYPAEPFSICRGRYFYPYAFWIRTPGNYTVRSGGGYLEFIEEDTCARYAVVQDVEWTGYVNYTEPVARITAFYMPTGRRGDVDGAWHPWARPVETWINGTAHLYKINPSFYTIANGWYIANRTEVATVAAAVSSSLPHLYGPVHFSALNKTPISWPSTTSWVLFFTIGADPGDGAVVADLPSAYYGRAEFAYIANETMGYFRVRREWMPVGMQSYWAGRRLAFYLQRYGRAEITTADVLYVYNARALACPLYVNMTAEPPPVVEFTRLDRGREFVLCNNYTSLLYVGLFNRLTGRYAFVDRLPRGDCVRMRYDGAYNASDTELRFFTSPQDYCLQSAAFVITGGNYTYGYKWYLTPEGLVRGPPISPDTLYEEMWRQLLKVMSAHLNATQQWLQLQNNLTKAIENYYRSLPQYQGTIRVESSTSVWLRTVLEIISRYVIPAAPPSGGGFTPAPLPGASALSAAAAAASVAVAWAASRRSLATAAFLAGFAVLASALFVYYLFGTSVSAAVILAGVVLMSIGAAAAWFRKTED